MKPVSRTHAKKPIFHSLARQPTKRTGSLSRVARTAKRYGKQTLREILLSKTFHSAFKAFLGLFILGSAMYGTYAFFEENVVNDVVVSKSEIVARVARHIDLPDEEPEAVVRVQDAEALKNQVPLYESVKEGDYILIYLSLAVVYDLRNDHVVALKSVRK